MAVYSSWTVTQLEKEKDKIEKAIAAKDGKERKKAIAAMTAAAKRNGYDVKELLADFTGSSGSGVSKVSKKKSASGKKTGKVAPKYKNPADGVTWSGRGRKPKWIEAHLAKHGNLDKVAL